MTKKMSNEELYLKLIDKGCSPYEADEYMHQMITYRYLDSLPPSEQHIRHALFMDNKAATGAYDADILGMEEGSEMFDETEDESEVSSDLPSYWELAQTVNDMKDKLNDVLIDKNLHDIVIKHNINEDVEIEDNEGQENKKKSSKKKEKGE